MIGHRISPRRKIKYDGTIPIHIGPATPIIDEFPRGIFMDGDCEAKENCQPAGKTGHLRLLDELHSDRETLRFALGKQDRKFFLGESPYKLSGFTATFQTIEPAALPDMSIDLGGGSGKISLKLGAPKVETGPLPSDRLERSVLDRLKNSMVYYKVSF